MKEREKEMESDLSLIEIAGEDDSLLPQIHNDDGLRPQKQERSTSPSNDRHFMCSPFLNVRSNVSNTDSSIACPSGSYINKNVSSANKSQTSNFSIEPQQMKRKRKGVGYNLRKSLAWNRAFFTEEGVLNPLELSMISSNLSSSSGKKLLGIQEEVPGSSYGDVNRLSDSADFHSQEENLYEELPTNTPNKDRKIGCDLLPKNASSTKDNVSPDLQLVSFQVKHKVLSVQDINRSGSKRSGCPRPVAPSSVKRPATTSMTKAANNEANFSRIPSCKRNPSLIRRTVEHANVSESDPKINQASQRAIVQKNMTTKSSAINSKSVLNKAKAGISSRSLTPKTSIHDARRNVTGSLPKKNSTISHRQSSTKASLVTGVMPKSSACPPLSDQDGGSSKIVVSLPLNPSCTDGNAQESHIPTAKPSGLRMPSPSLQFFTQGKVAAMQSPLQRNDQSKKYDVSNFSNASTVGFLNTIVEPGLPPVRKKLPKFVNDEATRRNIIPCPTTAHLKGVIVTNSDVRVAKDDSSVDEFENRQVIFRPSPALQIEDVLEDVTPNSLVDNALNVSKDVKYIPTGNTISGSLQSRQVAEVCYSHTNSEIKHGSPQNFQNNFIELDRTMENQIENAAAALDLQIPNVCSKTGELSHGDYSLNTAQLGAELLQEDKEGEQCPSQARKTTSNVHPGDYTWSSQLDTSLKQTVKSYRTNYDNNEKGVTVEKFITENQHPEANHHLVEKVDFLEGLQRHNGDAAEVNSMPIRLYRSGLESHDHPFKDKHENESNCEVYEVNDFIEKACERVKLQCQEDLYDSNAQLGDLKNQNSQFEDGKIIVGNDHELCLKDELLPTNTKSTPTVCSDEKVLVSFIEPCGVYESENPDDFTQATSVLPKSALNERKIVEQTSVKEVITGPLASATVENFDCFVKIVSTHDDLLPSEGTALESESSVTVSNNIIPNTTTMSNPSKSCLLSNEPELSADSRLSEQTMLREYIGPNEQKNPIALDENITSPSEIDATSDMEMLHESTTAACSVPDKDTNVHVKKSMEDGKQDTLVIKPPPSAAPFSEEWLAAFEAAGEEILTKKSGAVQNSPPDKPQPEPGPWSPVRRKYNQAIGPYDCTKYTNIPLPPDS